MRIQTFINKKSEETNYHSENCSTKNISKKMYAEINSGITNQSCPNQNHKSKPFFLKKK